MTASRLANLEGRSCELPMFPTPTKQKARRNGRALGVFNQQRSNLSSSVLHTATIVVLPEYHFPRRHMNHTDLTTARLRPRFGSHGHRQ